MNLSRRTEKFAIGLLLATLIAVGGLVFGVWNQQSQATSDSRSVFERIDTKSVGGLASKFSALEGPMVKVGDLPIELADSWRDIVSKDENQSVFTSTVENPSGRTVTIAGNDDAICLSDQDPKLGGATTCATPTDAANGKLILVAVCEPGYVPGTVRIVGLEPNDVERVIIEQREGGARKAAQVQSNLFETRLPAVDVDLYSSGVSGQNHIMKLPLDSMGLEAGQTCSPPGSQEGPSS